MIEKDNIVLNEFNLIDKLNKLNTHIDKKINIINTISNTLENKKLNSKYIIELNEKNNLIVKNNKEIEELTKEVSILKNECLVEDNKNNELNKILMNLKKELSDKIDKNNELEKNIENLNKISNEKINKKNKNELINKIITNNCNYLCELFNC